MEPEALLNDEWPLVLSLLPEDLDQTAQDNDAILRRRSIRSAGDLLRLMLAYAWGGLSARGTCAWAATKGICRISNVSLLERLQCCAPWLAVIVSQILRRNCDDLKLKLGGRSLRLVDASCVSRPGSKGTDRRLHLSFNLNSLAIDSIHLTDSSGGETLSRYPVCAGDIVVADRGNAHRRGVWSVLKRGADVLVRINWQNFPLIGKGGKPFDILLHLKMLKGTQIGDWSVKTAPCKDAPAIKGRVVALRKSPEATEKEQKKIREQAKKKHRTPDWRSLEAAGYIFVFTTLEPKVASASEILEMYRFRWQVEVVFKRLKGILHLDDVPKCSDKLLDSLLLSRLLGALLIDDLLNRSRAFSPWGYGLPTPIECVSAAGGYNELLGTCSIGLFQPVAMAQEGKRVARALQGYTTAATKSEPAGPDICRSDLLQSSLT